MIPFLIAGLDGRPQSFYPESAPVLLGRSFLKRMAKKATKSVATALNPVAQVSSALHTTSRVTRALAKPVQDLAQGKISKAFIDSGSALTKVVAAPITTAANSAGITGVEGVIDRNDPIAAVNRKTLEILKRIARPIVRSFAGSAFADEEGTDLRSKLRAQKTKIIAAVTVPGVAAATASGGPYAGAAAGALIPIAIDAVIEEVAAAGKKALESATGGGGGGSGGGTDAAVSDTTSVDYLNSELRRRYLVPALVVTAAGVGGFIWWRSRRRKKRG